MENRLVSTSGSAASSFKYDPPGCLHEVTVAGNTTRFLYDGDALVAEYSSAGALTRRYLHGDQIDEPWVQYYGPNLNYERRFLYADHQGSIIARSNYMGTLSNALTYDDYGIPGNTNLDRFGYTGQIWFKELGLFHYKARMYHPKLGRFLQTDPIFYADQINMYAYVGNDPVNKIDPTGNFAVLLVFAPEIIVATKALLFVGSAATVAAVASDAIDTNGATDSGSGSTSPTGKSAPIDGATWTNTTGRKGTDIWDKPGSFEDAVGDVEGLSEGGLTDRGNGVSTGTDSNGNEIVVRPGGGEYTSGKEKGERANGTIEIKPPRVEGEEPPPPTDKIRYR